MTCIFLAFFLLKVYNKWERRSPLCPPHVHALVKQGLTVKVQPSTRRVFPDSEYLAAGAEMTDDLSECSLILGVRACVCACVLHIRVQSRGRDNHRRTYACGVVECVCPPFT